MNMVDTEFLKRLRGYTAKFNFEDDDEMMIEITDDSNGTSTDDTAALKKLFGVKYIYTKHDQIKNHLVHFVRVPIKKEE